MCGGCGGDIIGGVGGSVDQGLEIRTVARDEHGETDWCRRRHFITGLEGEERWSGIRKKKLVMCGH